MRLLRLLIGMHYTASSRARLHKPTFLQSRDRNVREPGSVIGCRLGSFSPRLGLFYDGGMRRLAAVFLVTIWYLPAQNVPPEMLAGLQWRSVGPAATGGRIADLAVNQAPGQPTTIYVATSTGGVFKSVNDGVSF